MLPDIKQRSGIGKTVQTAFGGFDRRPEAGDGTFYQTEGLTVRTLPLLASRTVRKGRSPGTVVRMNILGMGGKLIRLQDGAIWYGELLLTYARHNMVSQMVPFGRKIILPETREMIDLSYQIKGVIRSTGQLPEGPAESEAVAWVVGSAGEPYEQRLFAWRDGGWIDIGPLVQALEASASVPRPLICGTEYQDTQAAMNTIWDDYEHRVPDVGFDTIFRAGDAVKISGCTWQPKNNQTVILRDVTDGQLRFYENTFRSPDRSIFTVNGVVPSTGYLYRCAGFTHEHGSGKIYFEIPEGVTLKRSDQLEYINPAMVGASLDPYLLILRNGEALETTIPLSDTYDKTKYSTKGKRQYFEAIPNESAGGEYREDSIKISRSWPKLDSVFPAANRLWGWAGNTLHASKLGDPANFYHFDGTSDDSWSLEVENPGAFTGGIDFGYPTFYKQDRRYRIYGTTPQTFQLAEQMCHGVKEGCAGSMTVLDGVLYYVSPIGVMADTGSVPVCVSEAFGPLRLGGAVAGGLGTELWVCGTIDGERQLFCMDTRSGVWIRDGAGPVRAITRAGDVLYALEKDNVFPRIVCLAGSDSAGSEYIEETGPIFFEAETNDYTQNEPNRKRIHRIQLRGTLEAGALLTIQVRYDSEPGWRKVWELEGDGVKKSWYLPVMLRRCDHFRLRFSGYGQVTVNSLALETRAGSAIH